VENLFGQLVSQKKVSSHFKNNLLSVSWMLVWNVCKVEQVVKTVQCQTLRQLLHMLNGFSILLEVRILD